MSPRFAPLLAAALAVAPLAPACAQQRAPAPAARPAAARAPDAKPTDAKAPDAKPSDKEASPTEPAPPYERDLLRLSEIMGALAFLRGLCAASDASEWPARMKAIMDAEGVTQNRRDRLAGAYNRGYRGYALTYRTCTASATEASNRYLGEGERLSQGIAARFGG